MNQQATMNILIFHIGSLGDTLISVPALRALKEHFTDARFTMLCDHHPGKSYVQTQDILDGSGLVDDYIHYPANTSVRGRFEQLRTLVGLLKKLRYRRFDAVVYLMRSGRGCITVQRDIVFFWLAGVRQFIGLSGFKSLPPKIPGQSMPAVLHETDQILRRLADSGVRVPAVGCGAMKLKISDLEKNAALKIVNNDDAKGKIWIAIAPGSKMPAKMWPVERYIQVVDRLMQHFDIWPVILGGAEDRQAGDLMLKHWGRGLLAAGKFGIREGIAVLQDCAFYLGNDTGTLHMAVAAGIPCIGIYSSRDYPGLWYPYGHGHKVFRTDIECEGCMLEVCKDHHMACILSIGVDEVYAAAAGFLEQSGLVKSDALVNDHGCVRCPQS
jgi:ADP-heptose:LPS heptosyltransferase